MLETLQQYRERTGYMWNSLPHQGGLQTNPNLINKVDERGKFKPFYGDTAIFDLPQDMIGWLGGVQAEIYARCGLCLAEKIIPDTFHITLHDLNNSPQGMPGAVDESRKAAQAIIASARQEFPDELHVRSNCAFSMVGTSIVMGFEPADEADCRVLMDLYRRFQAVVPLNYPLTLHATLGYYKPGAYDDRMLFELRNAVECTGREKREWKLRLKDLHYARFYSMNSYDVFRND